MFIYVCYYSLWEGVGCGLYALNANWLTDFTDLMSFLLFNLMDDNTQLHSSAWNSWNDKNDLGINDLANCIAYLYWEYVHLLLNIKMITLTGKVSAPSPFQKDLPLYHTSTLFLWFIGSHPRKANKIHFPTEKGVCPKYDVKFSELFWLRLIQSFIFSLFHIFYFKWNILKNSKTFLKAFFLIKHNFYIFSIYCPDWCP